MTKRRSRDDLSELGARLAGGVCPAAQRSRLGRWKDADTRALKSWEPGVHFAILADGTRRGATWNGASRVQEVIDQLTDRFREDRRLLFAVLFAPDRMLARIRDETRGGLAGAWMGACWAAEAAWKVVNDGEQVSGYAAGDRELLFPLAARLRFLALSEPMRWRAELDRAWWFGEADQDADGTELVQRVLGDEPWPVFVGQCREARRVWVDCLAAYQSHSYLVQASPAELEAELAAVVFRHGRGAPLGMSGVPLTDRASLTAEDKAVVADVTNQHLLPRFDLLRVVSMAVFGGGGRLSPWRLAVGVTAVLCGLAAVGFAGFLHVQCAAALSAACYVVIGIGIMTFGPEWSAPWLLRMPAAAAVGVIALVGLIAGGWAGAPRVGLPAAIVFTVASCGYLAVQLRNHGVAGRSLARSLAVAAIGAVHALMVSLLGLIYVAPAFVPEAGRLDAIWHSPGYLYAGLMLLLSTAWCLAVGVFSQILWDDQPITAQLAHQRWRK